MRRPRAGALSRQTYLISDASAPTRAAAASSLTPASTVARPATVPPLSGERPQPKPYTRGHHAHRARADRAEQRHGHIACAVRGERDTRLRARLVLHARAPASVGGTTTSGREPIAPSTVAVVLPLQLPPPPPRLNTTSANVMLVALRSSPGARRSTGGSWRLYMCVCIYVCIYIYTYINYINIS